METVISGSLERRMRRLERGTALALPWGKSASEWTDEQLMAVISEVGPLTDERLLEISRPHALILAVTEKASAEERVTPYSQSESGVEQ